MSNSCPPERGQAALASALVRGVCHFPWMETRGRQGFRHLSHLSGGRCRGCHPVPSLPVPSLLRDPRAVLGAPHGLPELASGFWPHQEKQSEGMDAVPWAPPSAPLVDVTLGGYFVGLDLVSSKVNQGRQSSLHLLMELSWVCRGHCTCFMEGTSL